MKLKIDEIKWIVENEFKLHPKFTFDEQTKQFMVYLGSPDTYFRERSLDILDTWIMKSRYSREHLIELEIS